MSSLSKVCNQKCRNNVLLASNFHNFKLIINQVDGLTIIGTIYFSEQSDLIIDFFNSNTKNICPVLCMAAMRQPFVNSEERDKDVKGLRK